MSFTKADPQFGDARSSDAIAHVVVPRTVDVEHFSIRRALPAIQPRMVGPFVFFDHFGPALLKSGVGLDVRPHPHIGLATLTYLFEGEIVHRDTLANNVAVQPGEIALMTSGRGIAHSERSAADRGVPRPIHGLQMWVALPAAKEEMEPAFAQYGVDRFSEIAGEGSRLRVAVGSAYGVQSPVETTSDTLFVDAILTAGASLPVDADHEERAIYTVSGEIEVQGDRFGPGQLLVLRQGDRLTLRAVSDARFVLLGGATMDGPRHVWWNFVSSRKERIEQAKADWKAKRFSIVPGDETEFIPLPDH